MSLVYIGAFPPGWGGVTIKNRDLYEALVDEGVQIKKIDLHKITRQKKLGELMKLCFAVLNRKNRFVIGISTGMRRRFTHALYCLNRKAMRKSILIVMGGTAARDISDDPKFMLWASQYKKIYVETDSMVNLLESKGMSNIALYPNCRHRSSVPYISKIKEDKLKCVFFSYIQPQKGVDIILDAAKQLKDIDFVFYGNTDPSYTEEFQKEISQLTNCVHKGIFKGSNDEVYKELKQYDVLLFPTNWDTEGVPGIIVEAKIAGLPCIVSNKSYNSELVENYNEGIVLDVNDAGCLINAIKLLDNDRELLKYLSDGSYNSSDRFYIENYIIRIVEELNASDLLETEDKAI